jgi:hypothetical protein
MGIHPTKIPKTIIRPLFGYLKYPYPYLSVYMLTGGRAGEWVGFHGFLPTLTFHTSTIRYLKK